MRKTKGQKKDSIINIGKIQQSKEKLAQEFRAAKPYKHIVIEGFFTRSYAEKMHQQFPSLETMRPSSAFSGLAEKKGQLSELRKMPPIFQATFKELMNPQFRKLLSDITGIKPLYRDQNLTGGGLHQGGDGSFLDIHADFNLDKQTGLYRRLNILIYLNKKWKDSYGGHLEMWDKNMTSLVKKVAPAFNRCLIFATDIDSFHGYAEMKLPEGVTRKSLAAYYYSSEPAPGESQQFHNTLFKARPGELRNKILYPLINSKLSQQLRLKLKRFLYLTIKYR